MTPLLVAARGVHVAMMRELLRRGAETDAASDTGATPLIGAVFNREAVEAVKLLLEYGADRSLRDGAGDTARDRAQVSGLPTIVHLLDTYFPVKLQMEQVLLGLRGRDESPLTRLAQHSAFEPEVMGIVAAFLSGKASGAFEQLQEEATGRG